jgi:hypothetical protein
MVPLQKLHSTNLKSAVNQRVKILEPVKDEASLGSSLKRRNQKEEEEFEQEVEI